MLLVFCICLIAFCVFWQYLGLFFVSFVVCFLVFFGRIGEIQTAIAAALFFLLDLPGLSEMPVGLSQTNSYKKHHFPWSKKTKNDQNCI